MEKQRASLLEEVKVVTGTGGKGRGGGGHKASTTSSIRLASTIVKPDVKSVVYAVATIIKSQMEEDSSLGKQITFDSDLYFFCEEKYMTGKNDTYDEERASLLREIPDVKTIYDFMIAIFDCAQFSPECCIISLIYTNRLIAFTGNPMQPSNWRPLILCSLLIAQKVWDDRYLSNADFAFIYPFFSNDEVNRLEQKFLDQIQYNVTVKASLYAKYYFEMRALYKDRNKEFPIAPLSNEEAFALEIRSHKYQDSLFELVQERDKRYHTIGSPQVIAKEKPSIGFVVIS